MSPPSINTICKNTACLLAPSKRATHASSNLTVTWIEIDFRCPVAEALGATDCRGETKLSPRLTPDHGKSTTISLIPEYKSSISLWRCYTNYCTRHDAYKWETTKRQSRVCLTKPATIAPHLTKSQLTHYWFENTTVPSSEGLFKQPIKTFSSKRN